MSDFSYAPCPQCGSEDVYRERSIDGDTGCRDCGLKVPHEEWHERMEEADVRIDGYECDRCTETIDELDKHKIVRRGWAVIQCRDTAPQYHLCPECADYILSGILEDGEGD